MNIIILNNNKKKTRIKLAVNINLKKMASKKEITSETIRTKQTIFECRLDFV